MKKVVFYLVMPAAYVVAGLAWCVDAVVRWSERRMDEEDENFWC